MSIVTKTGDKGTTGLFGGSRVSKNHPRMDACGTVDELNAAIGIALAGDVPETLRCHLETIQHTLFRVGADLATPLTVKTKEDRMSPEHVRTLEEWIAAFESILPPQTAFLLPGGSPLAAELHLARTICRRAERCVVSLMEQEPCNAHVQVYLNRLSDYLFIAARESNRAAGRGDVEVRYS